MRRGCRPRRSRTARPPARKRPEGRVTRIAYRTGPGPSMLEVSRNFEKQLAGAGYETLLACDVDDCGGIPFSEALDVLPIPQMWVDGFAYRYDVGRKAADGRRPGPPSWSARTTTPSPPARRHRGRRDRQQDGRRRRDGQGPRRDGAHRPLRHHFDTDQAVVKPESRPTLDEIAGSSEPAEAQRDHRRPHRQPGRPRHNMDLSQRRAAAVAAQLADGLRHRGGAAEDRRRR